MQMINTQKPEPQVWTEQRFVEVEKIWCTIQGEGPYAGMPAIFIRLSGCNLHCLLCDTIYTKVRQKMNPMQIANAVKGANTVCPPELVVISGGEPFRQNITRMVRALLMIGRKVQIETNGTYFLKGFPYDKVSIICSPKTTKVNPDLEEYIQAYKYIIDADWVDKDDGLPTSVLGEEVRPARPPAGSLAEIYVQPLDTGDAEKNEKNLHAAVDSVMERGFRLSIQSHKIAGLE